MREVQHQLVIGIEHPHIVRARVAKQQPFVGVVRLRRRVAIQMIRREVRQHAYVGGEMRAVMELER